MGKLRHISRQGYTIINNDCLKDKELDIEERGLLLTLVSLPDDWIFSIAGLRKILPCGKDKISGFTVCGFTVCGKSAYGKSATIKY